MEDVLYYLGFNLVPGIGPTRLNRLIARCSSLENAWHATVGEMQAAGLDGKACASLLHARATFDLEAEYDRVTQGGVRLISRDDPAYPPLLLQTPHPSPLLYVRGTLLPADRWAVAIVGTRNASTYGRDAARKLAQELAAAGVTIVSGLALGIDAAAHDAALRAGGRTIAVLGSGVDQIAPQTNHKLGLAIIEQGALVSEYPIGTQPIPTNYPPRNRIISGLSLGVIVVEAATRSGALITVEFALEQNRDVFAVPGSIFSPRSEGTNQLIRNGAQLVTCADDVLLALSMEDTQTHQAVAAAVPDTPAEALVLRRIEAEPRHIDAIGRETNLAPADVSVALAMLELKGLVKQVGNMEYVLARETVGEYWVQDLQ